MHNTTNAKSKLKVMKIMIGEMGSEFLLSNLPIQSLGVSLQEVSIGLSKAISNIEKFENK